ncbi:hypothetical protein F5Y19DRAFT_480034 [Xylariaceae sp. FL1651]|nr:hypothetical protein F5Y19DRAFT_480034 [Xylariaceae sp. FL1651]
MAPRVSLVSTVTQVIYLVIPPSEDLGGQANAGRSWAKAQDTIERSAGFLRLYWGRRLEEPDNVQLHIVRKTLQQHEDFLKSPLYQNELLPIFNTLTEASTPSPHIPKLFIRHAYLQDFTQDCKALGKAPGMPIGTAIYLDTDDTWDEGAWPLWTHVVRHVDGCRGVSGGKLVEPVAEYERNYLVYVGWESVEKHDNYHHTKHFANRRIILALGNKGWREYGHIVFEGGREQTSASL